MFFSLSSGSLPTVMSTERLSRRTAHSVVDVIKIFWGNLDFPKIKTLNKIGSNVWTCTKMWKLCYFKQNFTLELFVAFKTANSCCFGLRGNLDFPDFLQKQFYNINYWPTKSQLDLPLQIRRWKSVEPDVTCLRATTFHRRLWRHPSIITARDASQQHEAAKAYRHLAATGQQARLAKLCLRRRNEATCLF